MNVRGTQRVAEEVGADVTELIAQVTAEACKALLSIDFVGTVHGGGIPEDSNTHVCQRKRSFLDLHRHGTGDTWLLGVPRWVGRIGRRTNGEVGTTDLVSISLDRDDVVTVIERLGRHCSGEVVDVVRRINGSLVNDRVASVRQTGASPLTVVGVVGVERLRLTGYRVRSAVIGRRQTVRRLVVGVTNLNTLDEVLVLGDRVTRVNEAGT